MVELKNISKSYDQYRLVLNDLNATFSPGSISLLYGRSGSGKTTLLNCLSGVDLPQTGNVIINDTNINQLNENDRANFRLSHIGIIYQFFNLLPSLSVAENILLPATILKQNQKGHMHDLAKEFDIEHLLSKWPKTLSGGECQRVAICRALICQPKLILADEPTGNLDVTNRNIVMDFLKKLTKTNEISIIIATHDQELHSYADTSWSLVNGQLSQVT
tara:strand:+ start:564 stop:1217 length:654 start_codon:yes stop_codon:yes gene_type:complete